MKELHSKIYEKIYYSSPQDTSRINLVHLISSCSTPPLLLPLQIILEGKWSNFATLGISLIYLTTFVQFQCRGEMQKKWMEKWKWPAKKWMSRKSLHSRESCEGRNYLSKKRNRNLLFLLLQEFASFQNSLPKRRMQGFVSLESVTGIKSAYSQNECTQFPAFQENFLEINKLFLAVTQPSWRWHILGNCLRQNPKCFIIFKTQNIHDFWIMQSGFKSYFSLRDRLNCMILSKFI